MLYDLHNIQGLHCKFNRLNLQWSLEYYVNHRAYFNQISRNALLINLHSYQEYPISYAFYYHFIIIFQLY